MLNELEMKLKEYGLEPDHWSMESESVLFTKTGDVTITDDGENFWLVLTFHKQKLKTDSDWKAVAAFIRFIKGETNAQ